MSDESSKQSAKREGDTDVVECVSHAPIVPEWDQHPEKRGADGITRKERARRRCIYCSQESPDEPKMCPHLFPKYPPTPAASAIRRLPHVLAEVRRVKTLENARFAAAVEHTGRTNEQMEVARAGMAADSRCVLGVTVGDWKQIGRFGCATALLAFTGWMIQQQLFIGVVAGATAAFAAVVWAVNSG